MERRGLRALRPASLGRAADDLPRHLEKGDHPSTRLSFQLQEVGQAEHDRLSSTPSSGAEYRVYSDRLDAFHARLAVHLEHLQRRS